MVQIASGKFRPCVGLCQSKKSEALPKESTNCEILPNFQSMAGQSWQYCSEPGIISQGTVFILKFTSDFESLSLDYSDDGSSMEVAQGCVNNIKNISRKCSIGVSGHGSLIPMTSKSKLICFLFYLWRLAQLPYSAQLLKSECGLSQ